MAKIYITDTILRDAHQSQAATRMRLSDMLPACELLDSIGYWSLECWGGATFDACMRFLNEDPWERLRQLRKHMPNTKLQMLLRGEYGRLPGQVNEEVRRKAIGSDTVITCRPADLIKPEMPKYREETKGVATCEEDVLSYALFPQVASTFFAKRGERAAEADPNAVRELYVEDMGN